MKPRLLLAGLLFVSSPLLAAEPRASDVLPELAFYAISLIDTPYKYGGNRPDTGLDCSGFITHVFRQVAGMPLPRSSSEISSQGLPVELNQLQPGDLVFFDTGDQPFSHVGLYLGEDRFIHATSSKTGKVMVSDLSSPYWANRFNGARRLLQPLTSALEADR